ncbi:multidrug resistance-associated abc transporter [Fusarium sp. NRRL 52700]|nr:multidrug resistance-associated abc transporter [Fusarium sp. NRRL 52700]
MESTDTSYQYLLKDRPGISEDAIGGKHVCVEACSQRPWLQFIREWYLIPLYLIYTTTVTFGVIYWLNGKSFEINGSPNSGNRLTQSDVTTLFSAAMVVGRFICTTWQALAAWRCAFIILEKTGLSLATTSRLISWQVPTPSMFRVPSSQPGTRAVVALILLLAWPAQIASPLASGSLSWAPSAVYDSPISSISLSGAPALLNPWKWYTMFPDVRNGRVKLAAGHAFLASTTMTNTTRGQQMIPAQHIVTQLKSYPNATAVRNVTVPVFNIERFAWVSEGEALPAGIQDAVTDSLSGYLNISSPSGPLSQVLPGNTALLKDTPWQTLSDTELPSAEIFSGTKYAAIYISRNFNGGQGHNYDCHSGTSEFDQLPNGIKLINVSWNNNYTDCLAVAKLAITVGVTQCYQKDLHPIPEPTCFLSSGVLVAKTTDITADVLVQQVFSMMPEVQSLMAALGLSDPKASNRDLEVYLRNSLIQAYQGAWSALTDYFSDSDHPLRADIWQPSSLLQIRVSTWRMYTWLVTISHEKSSLPARELPVVSALTVAALRGPPVRLFTDEPHKGRMRMSNSEVFEKRVFANDRDRDITKAKMRLCLRMAAKHNHDMLVLGALGCGVYGIDAPDSSKSTTTQKNGISALTFVNSESSSHDTGQAVIQTSSDTVPVGSTTNTLFSELFTSSTAITLASGTVNSVSTTVTSASTTIFSDSTAITLATTTVTEATTTSNGAVVPAGRSIILQVNLESNNGERSLVRRALGGFVSPVDTDICTFASLFNLAKDQLFSNDFPIYYTSGEDYKELFGVDQPPRDSISTGFVDSGDSLVFRNIGLPNGEAQFCQTSDSRVYVVFTDGPPECVPVRLSVYDSSRCQNGQLVGVGETTIASGTSTSQAITSGSDTSIAVSNTEESTISPDTSSGTLTPSSYVTQSKSGDLPITVSKTEESTVYPVTSSGILLPSSRVSQSESLDLQTSGTKATPEVSSRIVESSVLLSSTIANVPTLEASTSNTLAATGTYEASSTDSILTSVASSGLASRSSLDLSDLSVTSTIISETDSTPEASKTTDIENTSTNDATSGTGSSLDNASTDTTNTEVSSTSIDTTLKTEAGTSTTNTDTTTTESITTQNTATGPLSSDTTATEEDSTTTESITTQNTTNEPSSTDSTTAEEDSTTTESITTQSTTTEPFSSDTTTTAEDTTTSNEILTTTDETATTSDGPTSTTADPTTTTRPYRSCEDLTPEYTPPNSETFEIFCTNDVTGGTYSDSSFAWDFQECMDRCAREGTDCRAITYERAISICKLYTSTDGHEFSDDLDYAEKDFCC